MKPVTNTISSPRVDPERNRFLDCYHCGLKNNEDTTYMHMRCWNEAGRDERDAAETALAYALRRRK